MSLKLQQKLSFQMIQSLKLLQVNTLQLEQLIRTELEMNPSLELNDEIEETAELSETEKDKTKDSEEEELQAGEEKVDWEEYLEEGFDLGGKMSEETDTDEQRFEPTAVHQISLEEHLYTQLDEKKIEGEQKLLAHFIIGSLENDGYLRISIDDIAQATQTDPYEVEEALNLVWNLEPAGIGARTLQECLALQLRAKGLYDSLAMHIISEAWDLFEKVKIPDIARKLNVTSKEIQDAIEVLKRLHPKPGFLINPEKPSTIIPDLIVEKVEGEFVVMLNDRTIPTLHISKSYIDMMKRGSKAKKDVKDYVREKLNSATWLIRSIEQRKNTMLRVMNAIIQRQPDFFEKGPPNL
jgi:RNA polymerase sigma-54 factor